MSSALPITRDEASKVPAGNCTVLPSAAGSCKWLPGLANFLWPKKPAATIHFLTDEPERTCYEWVRGKFDPPSRVLVKLLHTDQGWRVLEYLMRGCKQDWWLSLRAAKECAGAYESRRREIQCELPLS